ncbi:hypothetical protein ABZ816_04955 [Actinosynnema sp. NPDC047251]|uniref:Secreted protein n=1 Tax=Saccharothrix espanaensis (strain ATCC 51144 / DSM 44229 / JCM 9112 / NBRC 15066 / NRRL 15764) TaxID=1179773 RepID=K0K002_SACES|nr:hypothetical protein [Saccharothrix espanaensis]CCH31611.1 hypothetical protein BN6_43290 [Saccharothrix espanaensis DSM 44229]
MSNLTRRLTAGLLAAGALTATLGALPALAAAEPGLYEPTFQCQRIQDRGDELTAYGCRPQPNGPIGEPFYVQGPYRTFLCQHGHPGGQGVIVGYDCERTG